MAKKKKRKNQKVEPKNSYTIELLGVLLVFAVVIGIWKKGTVGEFIYKFGSYLAGTWAIVFLVLVSFIGIYMIIRRHKPNLLGMRIFGLYIALVGLVALLSNIFGLEGCALIFYMFVSAFIPLLFTDTHYTNINE